MSMQLRKSLLFFLSFFLSFEAVRAHCPLCTAGAAVAAGGAVWLGVERIVVGVFIGAFAVSTGWWFSRLIRRKVIPLQKWALIVLSFLLTVIPIMPLLGDKRPFYISLLGGYGTLLNTVYIIDLFLVGAIIGGLIVCITPWVSKRISKAIGGKIFPFQGGILTLLSP